MLQTIVEQIQAFLGYQGDVSDANAIQMALRTVLVYAITLALIRLGSKRFLSQATAFDVIVGIMLGSTMSSAITGSTRLIPTMGAGAALVGLHWILAFLASRTKFGSTVKGEPVLLIKDGQIQQQGVQRAGLSKQDLEQALRSVAQETDPANIKLAYLERNGSISMIPCPSAPRIVDVSVADGVQMVRIKLE